MRPFHLLQSLARVRGRSRRCAGAFVLVGMVWWCSRLPPAHWSSHSHHKALGKGIEWGVHNSYARQPVPWFGNHPRPPLHEQYSHGVRLFEMDAYWWYWGQWLVAHVPVVDQSSHVHTIKDAACMLRKIGADNTLLLDMKNFVWWPSCTTRAVQTMVSHLQACHASGPLTVLLDVTCTGYSNIECARALRNATLPNTTILFRGIGFWWLRHDCSTNTTSRGACCDEFTEPNMTGRASVPILAECHTCTRSACAAAMRSHRAPVTYVQVT